MKDLINYRTSVLLFCCIICSKIGYAQLPSSLDIIGKIIGIPANQNIKISLVTGQYQNVVTKNGEFKATIQGFIEGEPILVSIDDTERIVQISAESGVTVRLDSELKKWPVCNFEGSVAQDEYIDFQNKIQRPFNAVLEKWNETRRHKGKIDSTEYKFAKTKYELAATIYHKETLIWIINHSNSFFTPQLIINWWPRSDWKNVYDRLDDRIKQSYYGMELKREIAAMAANK